MSALEPISRATAALTHLIATGHRPAALIGSWFGYRAVLAADAELDFCARTDLFAPSTRHWVFGYRPYTGRCAQAIADCVALLDDDGTWHFDGPAAQEEDSPSLVALREAVAAGTGAISSPKLPTEQPLNWDNGHQGAHREAVLKCKEAIRAGEVYQTCISTRFHAEFEPGIDPLSHAGAWFSNRVAHYQPARAAFLPGNMAKGIPIVASLSPEEFLVRSGQTVTETPIKGTVPADHHPEDLLKSDKDVAENIMIVDLVRHDLGQVALTGSVRVTDLLSVRPAPGVWHLFSTVAATLPAGLSHAALIEACFPPASVTGTPKLRARELLTDWEPEPRGVHCGAIGAARGDDLELAVAIRTAEYNVNTSTNRVRVEAGIGGGITIDSTPEAEWAEIQAKAAPLLR